MMVSKYKMMCYSFFLGGVLSLVLVPAFAGSYGSKEEGGMEKQKMHQSKWFQKLDEDGDGKVSKDEFQKNMEKQFKDMDKDGDDSVTQEEWQAAAEEHKKKHQRQGHGGSQGHGYGGSQGQGQGHEGM